MDGDRFNLPPSLCELRRKGRHIHPTLGPFSRFTIASGVDYTQGCFKIFPGGIMTDAVVGTNAAASAIGSSSAASAKSADADAVRLKVIGAYKVMLTYQFGGTILLAGGLAIYLIWAYRTGASPPLLPLIVLAGMLGAFFSALTRLYKVDEAGAGLVTPTVGDLGAHLVFYSLIPPVVGAIAALVLYLVFAGKMLAGGLFPAISCVIGKPCTSVLELMDNYWPTNPEDYGRALVWSFAAGFSERLVPDVLQRMVQKTQDEQDAGGQDSAPKPS